MSSSGGGLFSKASRDSNRSLGRFVFGGKFKLSGSPTGLREVIANRSRLVHNSSTQFQFLNSKSGVDLCECYPNAGC